MENRENNALITMCFYFKEVTLFYSNLQFILYKMNSNRTFNKEFR